MREGAVGDARVWVDVVAALFALGLLAFVPVTQRRRRRLAQQTDQPPERGWIWVYLFVVGFVGYFVPSALAEVFDPSMTLWLALTVVFAVSLVTIMMLLVFVIKPREASTRQGPIPGAQRDDQAQ
jgi:uncharacterized membrane protein YhaH (DUF805 family)